MSTYGRLTDDTLARMVQSPSGFAAWVVRDAVLELRERRRRSDLVGCTEIAQRSGVAGPAAVGNWIKRHPDFPEPVARLSCGSVFAWAEVEEWLRATGRMP